MKSAFNAFAALKATLYPSGPAHDRAISASENSRPACGKTHSGQLRLTLGLTLASWTIALAKGLRTMSAHAQSLLQRLGLAVADLLVVVAAVLLALPFVSIAAMPFLPGL